MRRILLVAVLICLACAVLNAQVGSATVEGFVTRGDTGAPISNAQVNIQPANGPQPAIPPRDVTTDNLGHFIFENLTSTRYRVVVMVTGYFSLAPLINGILPVGAQEQVTLTANQKVNLSLKLVPGGSISGRILDADGKPLTRAAVEALPSGNLRGRTSRTRTDDLGNFTFAGLYPGQWAIAVDPLPQGLVASNRDKTVRTYYPGTGDPSRAVALNVAFGSEAPRTDFFLQTSTTVTISGKVTVNLPEGSYPAGYSTIPQLYLYSYSAGPLNANPIALPRYSPGYNSSTGEFEIRGVPSGQYDLVARIPFPSQYAAFAHATLDISNQDFKDVALQIGRGTDIQVEIRGTGGLNNLPQQALELRMQGHPPQETLATVSVSANMAAVIRDVPPGIYTLAQSNNLGASRPVCIRDITQNGQSTMSRGFEVGSAPVTVRVIFAATLPSAIAEPEAPLCPDAAGNN